MTASIQHTGLSAPASGQSIVIVGVGGQGTLLASRVLGRIGSELYSDVTVSEVHGMSQRGGSVVTYVRMGDAVASPIIEKGQADIVLAFELLEALRALPYLKKGGRMLINTQQILPMPVISGSCAYPEDILGTLKAKNVDFTAVDALSAALEASNPKCVNTVMLGVLAASTEVEKAHWLEAVRALVPAKTVDINLAAFEKGFAAGCSKQI